MATGHWQLLQRYEVRQLGRHAVRCLGRGRETGRLGGTVRKSRKVSRGGGWRKKKLDNERRRKSTGIQGDARRRERRQRSREGPATGLKAKVNLNEGGKGAALGPGGASGQGRICSRFGGKRCAQKGLAGEGKEPRRWMRCFGEPMSEVNRREKV